LNNKPKINVLVKNPDLNHRVDQIFDDVAFVPRTLSEKELLGFINATIAGWGSL
jgi:hypothetical protein